MSQQTPAEGEILSVSSLNGIARQILEGGLGQVWVEGEISNLARPASGHMYFSLKDDQAQVRCALFRRQSQNLACSPEDGLQVLLRARVSLYEARGDFQLIVEHMEVAGEGALRRAFEQLKQKLGEEGLFNTEHKQPLPSMPGNIAVITSGSGAVLHDIQQTLLRRFPAIAITLLAVPVQGDEAPPKIIQALQYASGRDDIDAIILARGGGSLEDLQPFNEEAVARALFACTTPVISAIGHETDVTIADFVADVRAATPTAAAEILSPDREEVLLRLQQLAMRMQRHVRNSLTQYQQKTDSLSLRVRNPRELLQRYRLRLQQGNNILCNRQLQALHLAQQHQRLLSSRLLQHNPKQQLQKLSSRSQSLYQRLRHTVTLMQNRKKENLRRLAAQLQTLSPLSTLERGYAIVTKTTTNEIIRSADDVQPGERITAKLANGQMECRVEETRNKND